MKSLPLVVALASAVLVQTTSSANATSCFSGPYVVFFDNGEAYIDVTSQETLDVATKSAANCGYGKTFLAGHVDFSEDSRIAKKRLRAVRAYLVAHGIPVEDIEMKSFGASMPRITKRSAGLEPQNRRVEILFVKPASSLR